MATRKKFSQEFKHEAVQLARNSEQPMSQVARDLGITPNLLTRWCRESATDGVKTFPGPGKPRDEELVALKRELVQVRKERDFLRETAAFFARASK
jgi:transposase